MSMRPNSRIYICCCNYNPNITYARFKLDFQILKCKKQFSFLWKFSKDKQVELKPIDLIIRKKR